MNVNKRLLLLSGVVAAWASTLSAQTVDGTSGVPRASQFSSSEDSVAGTFLQFLGSKETKGETKKRAPAESDEPIASPAIRTVPQPMRSATPPERRTSRPLAEIATIEDDAVTMRLISAEGPIGSPVAVPIDKPRTSGDAHSSSEKFDAIRRLTEEVAYVERRLAGARIRLPSESRASSSVYPAAEKSDESETAPVRRMVDYELPEFDDSPRVRTRVQTVATVKADVPAARSRPGRLPTRRALRLESSLDVQRSDWKNNFTEQKPSRVRRVAGHEPTDGGGSDGTVSTSHWRPIDLSVLESPVTTIRDKPLLAQELVDARPNRARRQRQLEFLNGARFRPEDTSPISETAKSMLREVDDTESANVDEVADDYDYDQYLEDDVEPTIPPRRSPGYAYSLADVLEDDDGRKDPELEKAYFEQVRRKAGGRDLSPWQRMRHHLARGWQTAGRRSGTVSP